ncbi:MAG: helix-turn-helix transcriptional regulator [Gammaproteobacteria bacterium]
MASFNVDPLLYTTKEVCDALHVCRTTLRKMISSGQFPQAPVVVGKRGKRWPYAFILGYANGNPNDNKPRGRPRAGS